MEHFYIGMYKNAVANDVMLQLYLREFTYAVYIYIYIYIYMIFLCFIIFWIVIFILYLL
jgi:hypothetical protein